MAAALARRPFPELQQRLLGGPLVNPVDIDNTRLSHFNIEGTGEQQPVEKRLGRLGDGSDKCLRIPLRKWSRNGVGQGPRQEDLTAAGWPDEEDRALRTRGLASAKY